MELENAEALLHAILDSSDDAIILETADGIVTGWNRGAERIFGYGTEEIVGQDLSLLAPPGEAGDIRSLSDRAKGGERIERYETTCRHKNGAILHVSLTARAIRDPAGRIIGLVKVARDITGARNAQHSIEVGEAHLRAIVEAIPDGMIVMEENGIVTSYSPAAERMFGYAASEVVGHNVKMLMPSPDRERHDSYLARYRRTGDRRIIGIGRTVIGRRKSGQTFPMDLAVGEVNIHGKRFFTGFVRDISERRQREDRIHELQSELLHVSRLNAMGQMAAMLAHELNQPLTAIANYAEAARQLLLDAGGTTPPRVLDFMQKAAGQAERAGEIIRRLRRFVEKRKIERSLDSLNDIVREASSLATIGAKSEAIEVVFQLAPDLPSIALDRTQIQQVIVNLVRNAVEVLRDAERRVITISSAISGDGMQEVAVSDTGPGVADAILPRLFQPFVSTKADGMGIGLSVCRAIVEAHGGSLQAENGREGGAVFRFTLPAGDQ